MKKHIISGIMGFGISILCLLPPIIHFVTGPLGPLIGGFAGGMKSRADLNGALTIGIVMGASLSLFLVAIGCIVMSFQVSLPDVMSKFLGGASINMASLLKIALMPFTLAFALGTTGAFFGGKVARKNA